MQFAAPSGRGLMLEASPMSLRTRLSIIISLLFIIGMILGVSFQISNARQRVAQEMESVAYFTIGRSFNPV